MSRSSSSSSSSSLSSTIQSSRLSQSWWSLDLMCRIVVQVTRGSWRRQWVDDDLDVVISCILLLLLLQLQQQQEEETTQFLEPWYILWLWQAAKKWRNDLRQEDSSARPSTYHDARIFAWSKELGPLSKKILQILSQRDLPLEHLQLGLLSDVCSKSFCSGAQVFCISCIVDLQLDSCSCDHKFSDLKKSRACTSLLASY